MSTNAVSKIRSTRRNSPERDYAARSTGLPSRWLGVIKNNKFMPDGSDHGTAARRTGLVRSKCQIHGADTLARRDWLQPPGATLLALRGSGQHRFRKAPRKRTERARSLRSPRQQAVRRGEPNAITMPGRTTLAVYRMTLECTKAGCLAPLNRLDWGRPHSHGAPLVQKLSYPAPSLGFGQPGVSIPAGPCGRCPRSESPVRTSASLPLLRSRHCVNCNQERAGGVY